ncbi:MAG: DUF3108 domain-containing protein [Bacteroidia bacterium]|nr:DUF3108 domain-containing protein [Bacteroidia bacterium]
MKKLIFGIVTSLVICGFSIESQNAYPLIKNESFSKGEQLEYRVSFLGITVGKAITKVDTKSYNINSRPCFKIDAFGETTGISWLYRVKDNWGAYIDTAAMITHVSYRKIRENNYVKDELVNFDHKNKKAKVKVMNKTTGVYEDVKDFDIPENATDLVGGFIQMRFFDFKKIKVGDTVAISGFFEDTSYKLKIMYKGKETISTKMGKIPCHVMVPIMPDNKLFNGENSITVWISDDGNKIPVKIQARMFIGHTGLELVSFRGLRNQLKIVQ